MLAEILVNILLEVEASNEVASVDSSFLLLWLLPLHANHAGLCHLSGPWHVSCELPKSYNNNYRLTPLDIK